MIHSVPQDTIQQLKDYSTVLNTTGQSQESDSDILDTTELSDGNRNEVDDNNHAGRRLRVDTTDTSSPKRHRVLTPDNDAYFAYIDTPSVGRRSAEGDTMDESEPSAAQALLMIQHS